MTYAQFNAAIRLSVWPDGEPENLVGPHKNYVLDALIDLQTKVSCLQVNHVDFLRAADSMYSCGASIFEAPRGFISKLSTMVPGGSCCQEVPYTPVSKVDLDCMVRDQQAFSFCSTTEVHPELVYLQGDVYVGVPSGAPYCEDYVPYGDTTLDKAGRASDGFYAINRGRIFVTPQIQSDELVKLEWDGVKKDFADTDGVDGDVWTREVAECVELYVRGKAAGIDDCDLTRSIYYNNENMQRPGQYQIRRADLIHTCEKSQRPPKRDYCFDSTAGAGGGMFLGSGSGSSSSAGSGSSTTNITQGVTQVFFGVGDPNGVVTATAPAVFYTALGALWYKIGLGTNNTGWEQSLG